MNTVSTVCATVISVAIVGAVTALAFDGLVPGGSVLTYFGGISAVALGIFGVHTGVNAGNGSSSTGQK